MKKCFYHATPFENLCSILDKGIKVGHDGIVYLTETPEDAVKFLRIRLYNDVLVVCVELEECDVHETFDHSQAFFKCRAFGYPKDIMPNQMGEMLRYKF